MEKINYETIKKSAEVNCYIEKGNQILGVMGFTEHSGKHAAKVAEMAGRILTELGYDEKTVELAKIAGYMHDLGNSINRKARKMQQVCPISLEKKRTPRGGVLSDA